MDRRSIATVLYFIIVLMTMIYLRDWLSATRQTEYVPYSKFEQLLDENKIKRIAILDDTIEGELNEKSSEGFTRFVTNRVDVDLAKALAGHDVEYGAVHQSRVFETLIAWVAPALIFVGIYAFFMQRMAGRNMGPLVSLGKSKAKIYVETDTKVTFADVAGLEEAKGELREVVEFLKDPARSSRLGARLPKGILLVGPPGSGKTLMARALAGETGVPFYLTNGAEFVEMFVGLGAARVRDLFEQARKTAPCIIFIDELDALGRARLGPSISGQDEKEQTLNQLLVELDGFDPQKGVVLLAATNRPEILDPALLRAGRFDRHVVIDLPDKVGRRAILDVHVRKVTLGAGVDLDEIAALTTGFSGADLGNLVNEAAIVATRRDHPGIAQEDFSAALERIVAGLERKSRVLSPNERHVIAVHESGHALVAMVLPDVDPVQKITIIPRGVGALGFTMQRPREDRYLTTRTELRHRIAVLLGGRTAERLVLGEISTGAADDIKRASEMARDMVMRFGMSDELGNVVYSEQRSQFLQNDIAQVSASEHTREQIDAAVAHLLGDAAALAEAILIHHRADLDKLAEQLLARETLTAKDMPALPIWQV
jgi:cell division protease FtsH